MNADGLGTVTAALKHWAAAQRGFAPSLALRLLRKGNFEIALLVGAGYGCTEVGPPLPPP